MGINIVADQWRTAQVPDLLAGPLEKLLQDQEATDRLGK